MKKWSIGKKLVLATATLLGLLLAGGITSLSSLGRLQGNMRSAAGDASHRLLLADQMQAAGARAFSDEKAILLNAFDNDYARSLVLIKDEHLRFKLIEDTVADYRPATSNPGDVVLCDQIVREVVEWKQAMAQIEPLLAQKQLTPAHAMSLKLSRPLADAVEKDTGLIRKNVIDELAVLRDRGERDYLFSRQIMLGVIVLGFVIGLLVVWTVIGIVRTLRATIADLSEGGHQIVAASGQIAATSQNLAQGASEQASSVEEISASMEEIRATSGRNGQGSNQGAALVADTVAQVHRSNKALEAMVVSMASIKESSEKVAKINKTIDEIAFQTNILALNAAVEAARAGEAGLGFAVVADEVRSLAQRSAVAARDTAELIGEAIGKTNEGARKLEQVAAAIHEITGSSGKVKELIDEVSESSRQEALGINKVATAISQVTKVTQSTAASAEECAAAAEELSAQSQSVRDGLRVLQDLVEGADTERVTGNRQLRTAFAENS